MVKSCKVCKQPFIKSSLLSFHAIPKLPDLRKKWLLALKLEESSILPSAMICSKHFTKEDFVKPSENNSKRLLKKGAIPSLLILSDNSVNSTENNNFLNPLLEHSYVKLITNLDNGKVKDLHKPKLTKPGTKLQTNQSEMYQVLRRKYLKSRVLIRHLTQNNIKLEQQLNTYKRLVSQLRQRGKLYNKRSRTLKY